MPTNIWTKYFVFLTLSIAIMFWESGDTAHRRGHGRVWSKISSYCHKILSPPGPRHQCRLWPDECPLRDAAPAPDMAAAADPLLSTDLHRSMSRVTNVENVSAKKMFDCTLCCHADQPRGDWQPVLLTLWQWPVTSHSEQSPGELLSPDSWLWPYEARHIMLCQHFNCITTNQRPRTHSFDQWEHRLSVWWDWLLMSALTFLGCRYETRARCGASLAGKVRTLEQRWEKLKIFLYLLCLTACKILFERDLALHW